jgi:hypothetical protein
MSSLIAIISDKDKAITRLVDQYESSSLDLAAAFPIISGLKSGRKAIKREQAAKHVPALRPFHADTFKGETERLEDSDVTTLELFQEALSECNRNVPSQLKSNQADLAWWGDLPERLSYVKSVSKSQAKKQPPVTKPASTLAESDDDETEDEFETHQNFKVRKVLRDKSYVY